MPSGKKLTIALAGNPNSGKTTIFNVLTGTRQKVGNWPGVTVEKKEGRVQRDGYDLRIVDLPGTYSLTPFSIEEIVARDFILEGHPDVVIDIIDASNLERSLYLATQLRELDCEVLFALNMADMARSRGIKINGGKLSELLGLQVVFTVGNKGEGVDTLLERAIEMAEVDRVPSPRRRVKYNNDVETSILRIQRSVEAYAQPDLSYNPRWTAIKLLEDDRIIRERVAGMKAPGCSALMTTADEERRRLMDLFDDDPEIIMTDERYGFIAGIMKEVHTTSTRQRIDISRNIDLVLTNRFIGFPIFLIFIWGMFQITFTAGEYPMQWIDGFVNLLADGISRLLPEGMFRALLVEGIIAGVGSVIVFLPNILILFFCIALFEDTGYMSRAAFLMDRIMHLIGLHGKSFIPMLMGFGCNVPAIMASRTLESEKDRILTILITPFMSCSAKLPVYIVLAGTFFGLRAGSVIFALYLLGIIMSIVTGRLLRSTLLRGADAPFVMELPPYRLPMLKSLLIHMWDRSKIFLRRMSGVILIGSIIIWTLSYFPTTVTYSTDYAATAENIRSAYRLSLETAKTAQTARLENDRDRALKELEMKKKAEKASGSYLGQIGKLLSPVFAPLGIDWRGSVALVSGFVAKEIVVSTLGVLYAAGGKEKSDALQKALQKSGMTPLGALSAMVFVLLYMPCLSTVAAIRRETRSLQWTAFSIAYSTSAAWLTSFCVYQGGKLLGYL